MRALTRSILGNTLKETGTISPVTKMVHDSFKVHKDRGYRTNNWVLEETRLHSFFRGGPLPYWRPAVLLTSIRSRSETPCAFAHWGAPPPYEVYVAIISFT